MSQEITEGFRLSPQQRHLWAVRDGDAAADVARCAVGIEGPLSKDTLKAALARLVERHEILRTGYRQLPGMSLPLQVVNHDADGPRLVEHDLSRADEGERAARLDELWREAARKPFDLARGSALRASLVFVNANEHVLLLSLSSLNADTATLKNLVRELASCYGACLRETVDEGEPLQYADLAAWQNDLFEAEGAHVGKEFWRRQELPALDELRLPFDDHAHAHEGAFRPQTLAVNVARPIVERLEAAARSHDVAPDSVLLACWQLVLWRLTARPRITVGLVADGRNYEELRDALGPLARVVPVAADCTDETTFEALTRQVDGRVREALRWQEFFSRESASGDDSAQYFRFAYESVAPVAPETACDVRLTLLRSAAYASRFGVLLRCVQTHEGLTAEWHYDAGLYAQAHVERLAARWLAAVEDAISRGAHAQLGEVEILCAREREELLFELSGSVAADTESAAADARCVHELFEAQAERTPDAFALVADGHRLTYAELESRANRLARYLRRRGVRAESRVGLLLGRGPWMVTALLGVLKAGGAYVPLEPEWPAARVRAVAADAGVRLMLTEGSRVGLWAGDADGAAAEELNLDAERVLIEAEDDGVVGESARPENVAYVIYTSGSTGTPRGVAVEHRQLYNYVSGIVSRLALPPGASYAMISTFAADLGHTALFPSLSTGGTLHVISRECGSDPAALARYFDRHHVDCLKIVPSHLAALLAHEEPRRVLPRRRLVLGGEASSWELIDRIQTLAPECVVLNHYGPTETTVGVLTHRAQRQAVTRHSRGLPLGRPLPNTQVYLLDGRMRPTPFGVAGELYVSGAGVARGYLDHPSATAAKFIPHPFSTEPGARLYRTGDVARFLEGGDLEFIGRADEQLKVRGYRVEPGEIEAVLGQHPGVENVKVLAREQPSGDRQLVAYVVPDARRAATVRRLVGYEQQGLLDARRRHELPDGRIVAGHNRNETDFMYREIFEEQTYLRHGVALRDGDCIFDVGANIGMFTLFAASRCADATIYAFEPIPPLYELLRLNASLHGLNVKPFNCGLSSSSSSERFTFYPHLSLLSGRFADAAEDQKVVRSFEFNRRSDEAGDATWDEALFAEMLAARLVGESFTCEMKTLSDVIREHDIERIDLLKIDVQKSELDVLAGLAEEDWPKVMQAVIEVHDIDDRLRRVVELFERRGFRVAVRQEPALKQTGMHDVYCVRPSRESEPSTGAEAVEPRAHQSFWTNPRGLVGDLRDYLKDRLPEYMTPAAFVLLDALPLTPNGKVDRKALPAPEPSEGAAGEAGEAYVEPRTRAERVLARVWADLLGRERVGVEENFFELGGDSILSIQVVARAGREGVRLTPKQVFRHQTIAALAAAVEREASQELACDDVPLTPAQRRFFEQGLGEPWRYVQSVLLEARPPLDAAAVRRAVAALFVRHEALRLRFRFDEPSGDWLQFISDAAQPPPVEVLDLGGMAAAERAAAIDAASREAALSLDIGAGPLLRAVLFEMGAGEAQHLLLAAHRLVVDGVSWRVLLEDLAEGLRQAGEEVTELRPGAEGSTYARWAVRLAEYGREAGVRTEADFWEEGARASASLPADFYDDEKGSTARRVTVELDPEETRVVLKEAPEVYRARVEEVLLTALVEAFGKVTGHRRLVLDLESDGREDLWDDLDLSRTVGRFACAFPLALEVKAADVSAALREVKEQLRRVPRGGVGYGVLRYLCAEPGVAARLRGLPRPDVRFGCLFEPDEAAPESAPFRLVRESDEACGDYPLDIFARVNEGRLRLSFTYVEGARRGAFVEAVGAAMTETLRALVTQCRAREAGDYTPSDFPLAQLNQRQLDLILSKVNRSGDAS